ncbi:MULTISPECIES: HAD-IA family hydrolase [Arthrobacter]|uniref:HAD-IA family hydrolase n=2 Tax=Arthrobacter TaxID=1663 RepID=A0ABU9KHQ8_9MICC|nr:HAD-IA family hydrolase [Arthrobacter sp. YJM1]MDP5226677.1 HAD-IA family hydrolase [Arthrobacter sp. YJM1]
MTVNPVGGGRDTLPVPGRPARLRLAVVDMSGTTVTDGGLIEEALRRAFCAAGEEPGSARLASMMDYAHNAMGLSKLSVFQQLYEGRPGQARQANAVFEQAYDELVDRGGVQAIPGAQSAMQWLRDAGLKLCLVTGFGRHTQNTILESLGWMGLADLSLCPEDAGRGRPWPDMILTAVLALDLGDVREVLVVGDTTADIQSGLRAGAGLVAGVLTGAHSEFALRAAGADAVVPSIRDIPTLLRERVQTPAALN